MKQEVIHRWSDMIQEQLEGARLEQGGTTLFLDFFGKTACIRSVTTERSVQLAYCVNNESPVALTNLAELAGKVIVGVDVPFLARDSKASAAIKLTFDDNFSLFVGSDIPSVAVALFQQPEEGCSDGLFP